MCIYNHMWCPHVRSVGGAVRLLSNMKVYKPETHRKTAMIAQQMCCVEAVCVCVLVSLSTSRSPDVNAVYYNIHEAAGLQSRAKSEYH